MGLAKVDMEQMAKQLRSDLQITDDDILDPFFIQIEGVQVLSIDEIDGLKEATLSHLKGEGSKSWSAMSVPLDVQQEKWIIVFNKTHERERQKVSLLEELWHIIQGHRLTSVVKVGSIYGRSFEHEEEHDAYYLAAATLLPEKVLRDGIEKKQSAEHIAEKFKVSRELVEYRIKRLGLWGRYKGKSISLRQH